MEEQFGKKRSRDETLDLDRIDAKRIHQDLQYILDEADDNQDGSEGLFAVMESFEKEISPEVASVSGSSEPVESRPELGYLLEASDDELGLPPWESAGGFEREEDLLVELPNYDAFEIGVSESEYVSPEKDHGDVFDFTGDVVYDELFNLTWPDEWER